MHVSIHETAEDLAKGDDCIINRRGQTVSTRG